MRRFIRRFNQERRELGSLAFWEIKEFASNLLNRSDRLYERRLRKRYSPDFAKLVLPGEANAVLRTQAEANAAWSTVEAAGLPHVPAFKDWDTLIAFRQITESTTRVARVLDAGSELWSVILMWLYLYGYKNLVGNNLAFTGSFRRGSILYEHGDITATRYPEGWFDAVTCLSVIEHQVPIEPFFAEMSRIMRAGARLVVSTDYWDPKLRTDHELEEYYRGQTGRYEPSYWTVFSRDEVDGLIAAAARHGLELTAPFDKTCRESPIQYREQKYTFICMTFTKVGGSGANSVVPRPAGPLEDRQTVN